MTIQGAGNWWTIIRGQEVTLDEPLPDGSIVVDVIADAINFRRGVTNSEVMNSFFRNTGDDAMAMWSHNVSNVDADENRNNVYDHNTIQTPTLANGIAIYGRDNTVSNNIVADPIREGSGLHAGQRFNSTPSLEGSADHGYLDRRGRGAWHALHADGRQAVRRDADLQRTVRGLTTAVPDCGMLDVRGAALTTEER